jgi:hypothetical protein
MVVIIMATDSMCGSISRAKAREILQHSGHGSTQSRVFKIYSCDHIFKVLGGWM